MGTSDERINGAQSIMREAALFTLVVGGAVYWRLIRPWHMHWGTRPAEVEQPLPGDDSDIDLLAVSTRAVSIDAPVSDVWPWIAQLGQDRGGFYSYSWLENLFGADIHNADEVRTELQNLTEGDQIRLTKADYWLQSPVTTPTVSFVVPEQTLVLQFFDDGTWSFHLASESPKTTRLLVRSRTPRDERLRSRLFHYAIFEVPHFIMERRMLLGIKRRAEALAQSTARHK